MPTLELGAIARAVDGELLCGDASVTVSSYSIDSRRLEPGGLFFALRGERTDGHAFLDAAARVPAAGAVVERRPEGVDPLPPVLIRVADVAAAMGDAAHAAREAMHDTTWIGLTGSAGKTSTKEFAAAALAASARTHRTPGNLNNHLGVPLTVLGTPDDTECAVVEMGMSAAGEIAYLCELVDPDVGLVTNVYPAHLEFFPDVDAIAAAKGELFAGLRDDAIAVVNLDDPHVRLQATRHVGPQVRYGSHPKADLRLLEVQDGFGDETVFRVRHADREHDVVLAGGGAAAARNALAALGLAVACGAELEPAIAALRDVRPGGGRGRRRELVEGMTLVDDAYNCSPAALESVLASLAETDVSGRRVVVFGDMLELGPDEREFHRTAGRRFADRGVDLLLTVGPRAGWAAEEAERSGVADVRRFGDSKRAAKEIGKLLKPGDFVLVKGSRGARLERVVDRLIEQFGRSA